MLPPRWRHVFMLASLVLLTMLANACDCVWMAQGYAWLDENRNGVQDEGEPPLEGVMFLIDDVRNNYQRVGERSISNAEGKADLGVFIAGCPATDFEVYAVAPPGLEHTTPARLAAGQERNDEGKDVFLFGFAYAPGVTPTPKPTPTPMRCHTFTVPYIDTFYGRDFIAFAQDGTGWIISNMHSRRLLALAPDGTVTEISREQDPLGEVNAHVLAADDHGNLWVGTSMGLSQFQPQTGHWTSFTQEDGLTGSDIQDIATLGGHVLVKTTAGIESLSPTGKWQLLLAQEKLPSNGLEKFIEVDNEVVYLTNDYLLRFWLTAQGDIQWEWLWHREKRPIPITSIWNGDMATTATLWMGGSNNTKEDILASWDLHSWEMTLHTFQSTGGVLGKDWITNVVAESDDRVWVGVGNELIRGVPMEAGSEAMAWIVYDARTLHVPTLEDIGHLAISPDKALWIRTTYQWVRCPLPD